MSIRVEQNQAAQLPNGAAQQPADAAVQSISSILAQGPGAVQPPMGPARSPSPQRFEFPPAFPEIPRSAAPAPEQQPAGELLAAARQLPPPVQLPRSTTPPADRKQPRQAGAAERSQTPPASRARVDSDASMSGSGFLVSVAPSGEASLSNSGILVPPVGQQSVSPDRLSPVPDEAHIDAALAAMQAEAQSVQSAVVSGAGQAMAESAQPAAEPNAASRASLDDSSDGRIVRFGENQEFEVSGADASDAEPVVKPLARRWSRLHPISDRWTLASKILLGLGVLLVGLGIAAAASVRVRHWFSGWHAPVR